MIEGTNNLIIVGIDPGTTSAVAILDLDGNLINHKSAKNFSKDQIIEFIISHGKSLIIGTDVANSPSLIEGIASNLGATLNVPSEDLSSSYKESLTATFTVEDRDAHTMDALAAAVYAHREYEDKLNRIRSRAADAGLQKPEAHEVVAQVLLQSTSTSTAIDRVMDDDEEEDVSEEADNAANTDWEKVAERRKQEIDRLQQKIAHLEEYQKELEEQVSTEAAKDTPQTESELKKRNRMINKLRQTVAENEAQIDRLSDRNQALQQALTHLVQDNWVFVPVVDSLKQANTDIVYCDSYRGGSVSPTIDVVVTKGNAQTEAYRNLQQNGIQIKDVDTLQHVVDIEHGYVIDPDELTAEGEAERFVEWLEDYKKRQTT